MLVVVVVVVVDAVRIRSAVVLDYLVAFAHVAEGQNLSCLRHVSHLQNFSRFVKLTAEQRDLTFLAVKIGVCNLQSATLSETPIKVVEILRSRQKFASSKLSIHDNSSFQVNFRTWCPYKPTSAEMGLSWHQIT